jgi:hypothetical protein
VREPDNMAARGGMLVGSCLAGIAFLKGLGMVHAISHMVGAEYNTQHGLTNAVILPVVLRYNLPGMDAKVQRMAQAMRLSDTSVDGFIRPSRTARRHRHPHLTRRNRRSGGLRRPDRRKVAEGQRGQHQPAQGLAGRRPDARGTGVIPGAVTSSGCARCDTHDHGLGAQVDLFRIELVAPR